MTSKELAYFEDAIGHEKNIISIIEETINNIEDEELISFFEGELESHKETKNSLINMLEVKCNE